MRKIYFYPHAYLRDRQLETIKNWPSSDVINPEIALNRVGNQVDKKSHIKKIIFFMETEILLLNIKWRPRNLDKNTILYIWGGITIKGFFITDLDNPWSLVGYNIKAMRYYSFLIKEY